jgi:hypothetical protein
MRGGGIRFIESWSLGLWHCVLHYTVSQPGRPQYEAPLPLKLEFHIWFLYMSENYVFVQLNSCFMFVVCAMIAVLCSICHALKLDASKWFTEAVLVDVKLSYNVLWHFTVLRLFIVVAMMK